MRGRSRRNEVDTELNITAFLNLMVVLIPFLLMSAAFTQLSVLELNLPTAAPPNQDNKKKEPKPSFEVTVTKNFLLVSNRQNTKELPAGILTVVRNNEEGEQNFVELNDFLIRLKEKYQDIEDITILLEEETPYNQLIQSMDSVRVETDDEGDEYELFPNIAIGDAPADSVAVMNERLGYGGAS